MVSNKEQEFKEALNNGKLAEAFLLAMNSAVELKITTWVESSQEDSTQEKIQTPEIEKKDTNPSQDKETPGHSLKSRVNLIQGEIENKIGDQFLNNDQLAKILPFHFHQVSLSSHNFRNNLQSLQKLFGFLAALNQQENSEQLLKILDLENQFITENPTEIPLPPLELGTKTPPTDVIPIPSIPSVKPQEKTLSPEQEIESQREIKAEIKAEIKEEILEEIKDKIADDSPIYPTPEMPVSDLDEDDWEESTFIPSALSFEDDNAQLETDIDEEDDDSFEILSLDDLEASGESEEDWGDVDSPHDNLELHDDGELKDEDLPPLKFDSGEEYEDSDIPIIELEEIAEEDWGDVANPEDNLDLDIEDQGDIPVLNLDYFSDDQMESQEDIPASELAQIPEEDWGDVDSPHDNLVLNLDEDDVLRKSEIPGVTIDEEIPETDIPVIELDDLGNDGDWGDVDLAQDDLQLEENSFELDLDGEETPVVDGEGWEESNDILELESPSEESDFESANLQDMDSIADFDFGEEVSSNLELEIEETPVLEEESWEETDQILDLESSDNELDNLDNLSDFDFGEEVSSNLELEIEETPVLEEESWEETDQILDLESSDNESDNLDNLSGFDFGEEVSSNLELEIEETPVLEEESWEETDQILDLESSDNESDNLDNLSGFDFGEEVSSNLELEIEETPVLEEESWEETDRIRF
jgi:hypothetical protein